MPQIIPGLDLEFGPAGERIYIHTTPPKATVEMGRSARRAAARDLTAFAMAQEINRRANQAEAEQRAFAEEWEKR